MQLPRENIYGHFARLEWLRDHLDRSEPAVELGCGTGYMITLPLRVWGYQVTGVDLDERSVAYGRRIMREAGISEDAVQCVDIADYRGEITVLIASEVLEHLADDELDRVLDTVRRRLARGGRLLVTIPNGYGWFEWESALWFKLGLGRLIELARLDTLVWLVKRIFVGNYRDAEYLSTLAESPHMQRFTLDGICRRLEGAGFDILETRGSVLICGPFSNLLFTGCRRVMRSNLALGRRWPRLASDFQLVATPR